MSEIQARHRLIEKEAEIRILKQDRKIRDLKMGRQRILIGSMIGLAISFALLALLALYGYRAKRRANRDLELLNIRLDDLSRSDPLTGLSNRRDMMEKLKLLQSRADREATPLALMMVDIDDFKSINDTLGHNKGDHVLRRVARTLRSQTRGQDLLARWGGEEFILLLPQTDIRHALSLAEKFRIMIQNYDFENIGRITCSFGVTSYRENDTREKIIKRADSAMYKAKATGRNCVVGIKGAT